MAKKTKVVINTNVEWPCPGDLVTFKTISMTGWTRDAVQGGNVSFLNGKDVIGIVLNDEISAATGPIPVLVGDRVLWVEQRYVSIVSEE